MGIARCYSLFMKKVLDKTQDDYFANEGWSSKAFVKHTKAILELPWEKIKIGRTVIHATAKGNLYKFYVHHNGRDRHWATVTDKNGNELLNIHASTSIVETVHVISKLVGL